MRRGEKERAGSEGRWIMQERREGGSAEGREQGTWNKGLRERSSAMTHPTDHMSIAALVRNFFEFFFGMKCYVLLE